MNNWLFVMNIQNRLSIIGGKNITKIIIYNRLKVVFQKNKIFSVIS